MAETGLKQAVTEMAAKWEREANDTFDGMTDWCLRKCAAELRTLVGARRTWDKGDPEPDERGLNLVDRDGGDAWYKGADGAWSGPYGYSLRWTALLDMHAPLMEAARG